MSGSNDSFIEEEEAESSDSIRIAISVLGKIIFTANGWDDCDINKQIYYDVRFAQPSLSRLNGETISLDYATGVLTKHDDDGYDEIIPINWVELLSQ